MQVFSNFFYFSTCQVLCRNDEKQSMIILEPKKRGRDINNSLVPILADLNF